MTTAPRGFEGEGFPVRRAFAGVDLADLDPFIHLDQMGEVEYAPGEPKGTPWHPHRGFETVTYMIDGVFEHQDSNGGGGVITNGDTQWMTAGAGILHIEKPPEWLVVSGGLFHGLQLWVNLPAAQKLVGAALPGPARRARSACSSPPTAARSSASSPARSAVTPVPGSTYTPMTMVHATLSPGARLVAAVAAGLQRARLRAGRGRGPSGPSGKPIGTGQLAVFGPGDAIRSAPSTTQESRHPKLEVIVLGGRPIREPVAWMGPFVMNTREEVMQAVIDYQAGRLGSHPGGPQRADHDRRGAPAVRPGLSR